MAKAKVNDVLIILADKDGGTKQFKFEEAQKKVNDGWSVKINKSGTKLVKETKKKTKK